MKKVLLFSATWCTKCTPVKKIIATTTLPIDVDIIDIDDHPNLTKEFGIRGVPTLVVVEEGKASRSKSGSMSKEQIIEFIGD